MNLSAEQEREWKELISRPQSVGELLSNPKFWEFYFFAFCNDKIVRKFAEVSGMSVDYIKNKRNKWLQEYLHRTAPYYHHETNTLH